MVRAKLELARRSLVTVPGLAIDSLMAFLFMLANALGTEPFRNTDAVIEPELRETGAKALMMLRELLAVSAPGSLDRNPIRTWQLLAESDSVAYCPFAYGYSNYSRRGYGSNLLTTGGLLTLDDGTALRSTLGGAGIAISAKCRNRDAAVAYATHVANPWVRKRSMWFQADNQDIAQRGRTQRQTVSPIITSRTHCPHWMPRG